MPEINVKNPLSDLELDRVLQDSDDLNSTIQKLLKRKAIKEAQQLTVSSPSFSLSNKELEDIKTYMSTKEKLPDLHETFELFATALEADNKQDVSKYMILLVKELKQNLGR